jgi:hypothetical protein
VRARTSSVLILSSEPMMASAEPCTSALMTTGSSEAFLEPSLAIMSTSETEPPDTWAFSRFTR